MTPTPGLHEKMSSLAEACRAALSAPPLAAEIQRLGEKGLASLDDRFEGLSRLRFPPAYPEGGDSGHTSERILLLRAALRYLPRLPQLQVHESVKLLWCKEVQFIAGPPADSLWKFTLGAGPFHAMCRIIAGHKFPAGHHFFEVSAFPRSWLPRIGLRDLPRTLRFFLRQTKGFGPLFETHLNSTMHTITLLIEREFRASFYRMACSLKNRPEVRGIMANSWLHSPETHRVSPHLRFMNKPFEEAGGTIIECGPAAENDGFLAGSEERERLYRSGLYRPTFTSALCSRDQALRWAAEQTRIATFASIVP